jgi:hypothetical protein
MNLASQIALFGWVPLLVVLFAVLPSRVAVATGVIGGVLFLPMSGYILGSGLPNWDKLSLSAFYVLVVGVMFDGRALVMYRPKWYDIFAVLVPAQALISSLLIGNGIASFQTMTDEMVRWFAPYMLGRLFFTDLKAIKTLALAVVVGGLVYAPFCLWEIRMSPQLHGQIYGFHQHSFMQSRRGGGFRPVVFMQHGLMVGLWMAATTAAMIWLWLCGSLRHWKMPVGLVSFGMFVTAILCKSTGAAVTMLAILGALAAAKWVRWKGVLIALACFPIVYQGLRATHLWDGAGLVSVAQIVSADRASSLETRLRAEAMYVDRAMQRPLTGWGGWGSYRVDDQGEFLATPDGLWIFMFGKYGLIGLMAMNLLMLLPVLRFARHHPVKTWETAEIAPAVALATISTMYALDNLFNAMINPVYVVAAGALMNLGPPVAARVRGSVTVRPLNRSAGLVQGPSDILRAGREKEPEGEVFEPGADRGADRGLGRKLLGPGGKKP